MVTKLEETIYALEKTMGGMRLLYDLGHPDEGALKDEDLSEHWFQLFGFTLDAAQKNLTELRAVHKELMNAEAN